MAREFTADFVFETSRTYEYGVTTRPGLLADVGLNLRSVIGSPGRAVVITDRNVESLYASMLKASLACGGFDCEIAAIEAGEPSKSLAGAIEMWDELVRRGFQRRGVLVALGGGVVTDLTGFVAAGFMRGVSYVNVPTTLVAQLDAAVGSKVGVNHSRAKNLIGFFHHPLAVYNDPALLSTLTKHDIRQGIAEAIKVAVIGSEGLFAFLEANVAAVLDKQVDLMAQLVAQSLKLKYALVEPDLYEQDLRRALNFGHAIGHSLETAAGYCSLSHGDAISIGMASATRLARARGLLNQDVHDRIMRLLENAGLPTSADAIHINPDRIWEAMSVVRWIRNGHLSEVMPTGIGCWTFTDDISKGDLQECVFQ